MEIALPLETLLRLKIATLEQEIAMLKGTLLLQQRDTLQALATRDHQAMLQALLVPLLADLPVSLDACHIDFARGCLVCAVEDAGTANATGNCRLEPLHG